MATLAEMQAMKAALEKARFSGNRKVQTGSTSIEYKTDAEMAAALSALNAQIAAAQSTKSAFIRVASNKGL